MDISNFIFRFRWPIVILSWAISIGFALAIPKIVIDPDVKALIPGSMPAKINTDKIEEMFGGSDMIMVMMEQQDILADSSLERLQSIDQGLRRLPQI
jgi:predicted RND superfamily exporter protein